MAAIPESHLDLLDAEAATMATIGPDGRPQLTEVWFVRDGDTVAVSINTATQKARNLLRDPRCSLLIVAPEGPYRYLELRGDAEVTPDDDYSLVDRVDAKYDSDLRSYDGLRAGRLAVRLRAVRVHAADMRS